MNYHLHRLAAGNYDLILDEIIIGSVVRSTRSKNAPAKWRAELSENWETWPHLFTAGEHVFGSLEEVADWLGASLVVDKPSRPERAQRAD